MTCIYNIRSLNLYLLFIISAIDFVKCFTHHSDGCALPWHWLRESHFFLQMNLLRSFSLSNPTIAPLITMWNDSSINCAQRLTWCMRGIKHIDILWFHLKVDDHCLCEMKYPRGVILIWRPGPTSIYVLSSPKSINTYVVCWRNPS